MGKKLIFENGAFTKRLRQDLNLTDDNLEIETLLNQTKENRYIGVLYRKLTKLKEAQRKLNQVYKELHDYYTYQYQSDPINNDGVVLEKSEIKFYIKADKKYIVQQEIVDNIQAELEFLQDVKKMFQDRNWSIKNRIDLKKWLEGER